MNPLPWRMVYLRDDAGVITHYLFYATTEGIETAIQSIKEDKELPPLFAVYKA